MLPTNSTTKNEIPGTSKWTGLRKTARLQGWPKYGRFPCSPHRDLARSSLVAHNISGKSGIAMATPRSIVDQVTVCLERQETGDEFDSLRDQRCSATAQRRQDGQSSARVDPFLPLTTDSYAEMNMWLIPRLIAKWQLDVIGGKHGSIVRKHFLHSLGHLPQSTRWLLVQASTVSHHIS
jgi:hypothetical protein